MAELWFVGAGLGDENDLSTRALEVLKRSQSVYAEEYTSLLEPGTFDRLGRLIGKPIGRLSRQEIESEGTLLAALSAGGPVALVVAGDPFFATTHVSLRSAVERSGHTWRYLPGASVFTAVSGFLGLSPYRFGRTVSVPFPDPSFQPTSPIESVVENRAQDLHTLLLLDLNPSAGKFMTATEAIAILSERDHGGRLFVPVLLLAVIARVGTAGVAAWFGRLARLKSIDFGPPLHSIVVPSQRLHVEEERALESFRVD